MALRIKSKWFQRDTAKTPQQTASVMAFITWRVVQHMLKHMRTANFSIDVGAPYFAFTREALVFLTIVLDRMAYARMGAHDRVEFVSALVRRVAEILQENEDTFLGPPPDEEATHFERFIDLFNGLSELYADFGFDETGPDFAFVRYFGHRIEALMPEKDQRWVIDQIMGVEVPEAVAMLQRAMPGVLATSGD